MDLSSTAGRKWVRLLHHEREQRIRLEEMVETLARQHSHLEEEAKEQMSHTIPSPNQGRVASLASGVTLGHLRSPWVALGLSPCDKCASVELSPISIDRTVGPVMALSQHGELLISVLYLRLAFKGIF